MSESGDAMSKENLPPQAEIAKPRLQEPIADALHNAEAVLAQSDGSQVLENRAEEIVAEDEIDKKIKKGWFSSWGIDRRMLTRSLAAGIALLGVHMSDVFAGEKYPIPEIKPTQIAAVEKVTGKSIVELKEKFDIEIPVEPDASGKYLVHIGQTHEHPGSFIWKAVTHDKVVEKQKGIEDLAVGIIKTNDLECVFAEGLGDEKTALQIRDTIKSWQSTLAPVMEKPIQTWEDVNAAFTFLSKYDSRNKFANAYLGPMIAKLQEKVIKAIEGGEVIVKDDNEKELLKSTAELLVVSGLLSGFTNLGKEPNPYAAGTDFKMLIDGNVPSICPAEREDLNKQAFEAMERAETVQNEYYENLSKVREELRENTDYLLVRSQIEELMKKDQDTLTDEEQQQLADARGVFKGYIESVENDPRVKSLKERLDQVKADEKHAIFTAREGEILRKIDFYDQQDLEKGKMPGDRLVIYGANHDLTEELEAWNRKNSPGAIDRGLIKFTLKESNK